MKRRIDWDVIETRDSIREAAYGVARSGLFENWQGMACVAPALHC
jgi:hypothetical protein